MRQVLALMAGICLTAAACGGGGAGTTEEQGAPVEVEESALDRSAVLRYGFYISATRLDPHLATSSSDNPWIFPAYDRLVHTDPDAQPMPGLATDWEFNDDGTVLEMQLREGVTFHDGEPFNAEAVRANIERGKTLPGSAVASTLAVVDNVEVVDELTVRFNLNEPSAGLPLVLSDRAGAMISPAAFDNPDLDLFPVGAGMFRVVDHLPEEQVVYERFEDYWDVENVHLAGLEITNIVEDTTRLNALQSGQIDAAELDPSKIPDAEASGLQTVQRTDLGFGLLQFNSQNVPELADERVRRAINHAINRQAIVEGILFGYGEASVQPFPEGYFAHSPEITTDYYEYDPELARELMAEAGYADGFDLEILTTTTPSRVRVSEALIAQLGEIGIRANLRTVQGAVIVDIVYAQQQGESWMIEWGGRPDPALTIDLLYLPESFSNPSGLSSERVIELFDEAQATFDEEDRAQVLQELTAAIVEANLDVVPLYFSETIAVHTDRVQGLEIWVSGRPEFRGVAMTAP